MAPVEVEDLSYRKSRRQYRDVKYVCRRQGCGNTQTITYELDEKILPVTCCVKCRSGFGVELSQMIMGGVGMFPQIGKGSAA